MNHDEHFERYFRGQPSNGDHDITPVATIMARGRRRRRRAMAARGGLLAGIVAVAGVTITQQVRHDPPTPVASAATGRTDLDWHSVAVDPAKGLGWSLSGPVNAVGATYDLSTAPGAAPSDGLTPQTRALYRSTDGTTWDRATLPDGLRPAALVGTPDRLYAVGTAPAGGSVGVNVASTDGGSDWSVQDLPLDLAARRAASGLDVQVQNTELAVHGDVRVVTVSLLAAGFDPMSLVGGAADVDDRSFAFATNDGVVVVEPCPTSDPASGAPVSSQPIDVTDPTAATAKADNQGCDPSAQPRTTHTWAQLGVSDAKRQAILGSTVVFRAEGDGAFREVQVTNGAAPRLVAADDGFWLVENAGVRTASFGASPGEIVAWHAADGATWNRLSVPGLAGYDIAGRPGVVGGRAAFSLYATDGAARAVAWIAGADGGRVVDLSAQVPGRGVGEVAFGPLGMAAVTMSGSPEVTPRYEVLYSPDLEHFGTEPVEPAYGSSPQSVSVTADAVTVRSTDRRETGDDPEKPGTPLVFVGTPR
jgi:hypothetical protein